MTITQSDLTGIGPRYEAIARAIADEIASGVLAPGDRLPPQRELAAKLGVTVGTVGRAYTRAEQRGLVRAEVGRGTFVRDRRRDAAELVPPDPGRGVDLSMNMPIAGANAEALAHALAELARNEHVAHLLRYMPMAGHEAHRDAASRWIARSGFEARAENIVLMEGAQQGLAAAFDVLVAGDEPVLVEACTYSGILENARLKGVRLEGVELDADGMRPDDLERKARQTKAKVVFIVPTIQNPTAVVMSEARRREIADVAARQGLTIVEDDVYGYIIDERPAPIASLLPEQTVYVTSASKCLAPGLRVGWLVAPRTLVDGFVDRVYAQSVAQPALNHEIVRRWIDDGTAAGLARELAVETAARHALALESLQGFSILSHPASFHMLLELPGQWRRDDFVAAALDRGIRVSSLGAFAVDPESAANAVRLSLIAVESRAMLAKALAELDELLDAGPQARRAVV